MLEAVYKKLEAIASCLVPYYWLRHAIIALALSVAFLHVTHAWAWAGAMFYLGREIRDREKLGAWDWPGLLAPLVACAALWMLN